MTDLLHRTLAPLGPRAWEQIEQELTTALKHRLSARRIVDFTEPAGADLSAVDTHRVDPAPEQKLPNISWGTRRVLPLIEVRAPISLSRREVESLDRGADDANLESVSRAAEALAHFEESLVYRGIVGTEVQGIEAMAAQEAIEVTAFDDDALVSAVVEGAGKLAHTGIGGPYQLVLAPRLYTTALAPGRGGRPMREYLARVLGGDVHASVGVAGGLLLSQRGGDFVLTVGQDAAIGYDSHDRETVRLFAIETLMFRVLEPKAALRLKLSD